MYVGNVGSSVYESTYCPNCGKLLIARSGYRVTHFNLDYSGGRYRCPRCGREVPIRGRYVGVRGTSGGLSEVGSCVEGPTRCMSGAG